MGNVDLEPQNPCQSLAKEQDAGISAEKTSRYDDPFYRDIFGAFEGPPDLSRRYKEIFGQIMDEKYGNRSAGSHCP